MLEGRWLIRRLGQAVNLQVFEPHTVGSMRLGCAKPLG